MRVVLSRFFPLAMFNKRYIGPYRVRGSLRLSDAASDSGRPQTSPVMAGRTKRVKRVEHSVTLVVIIAVVIVMIYSHIHVVILLIIIIICSNIVAAV